MEPLTGNVLSSNFRNLSYVRLKNVIESNSNTAKGHVPLEFPRFGARDI